MLVSSNDFYKHLDRLILSEENFPFQGVYAWIDGNPFYFCWDSELKDFPGFFSSYLDCDSCQMKQDAALLLTA